MGAAPRALAPSCTWGDVAGPRGSGQAGQHGAGLGLGMLLLQSTGLSREQPGAPGRGAAGGKGTVVTGPSRRREASRPLLPAQSRL